MKHIYKLEDIHLEKPSVVTIGVFDGIHRGHQMLLQHLTTEAHKADRLAVALTFFPHPDVVIRGLEGRYYLMHPEQRAALMLSSGVDYVVTHPFDETVRQIRAADFVDRLIEHLNLKSLWVGADFAMGYKREGNVDFLRLQGQAKGFEVDVIELVSHESNDGTISSSRIRDQLLEGNVERVRELLGRGYSVSGEVIHGEKRGRQIGFPTANIDVWDQQIIPANGVYAGWATINGETFMAVTNVGVRPTFDGDDVTVEAHLLDFQREIYGDTLTVSFETRLRPEKKFNGIQELMAQIKLDAEAGRSYLKQHAPAPS